MTKKNIILSAFAITIILSLILIFLGKNIEKLLALAALIIFMLFALLDPPPKHKNFSGKDTQNAVNHSLGKIGNTETDAKIRKYSKKKKYNKNK